jgi:hypothetical protein
MAASYGNDPLDAPQFQLGSRILASGVASLTRAAALLNNVYARTRLVLGVWPGARASSVVPYESEDTSAAWVDLVQFRVHVPAGYATVRFVVRSARLTGDGLQIRLASDVDAGMAAATTITPNTAGTLTPTVQQTTATITPGDQILSVQYIDTSSTPGTSAIYSVVALLDNIA